MWKCRIDYFSIGLHCEDEWKLRTVDLFATRILEGAIFDNKGLEARIGLEYNLREFALTLSYVLVRKVRTVNEAI